ncbi:MAG: peptide chain release factor 2 [Thermoleophilaceae bacterium]|nr:peptide chain release factor 2 [Thermoleophilaceae bacterium]
MFDPPSLEVRAAELEREMGEPGFWDDQDRAAQVSSDHSRVQRRLDGFRSLEADLDDLEELEEMAAEDDSIAAELDAQRASIEARLQELEEARLFSGPYDPGDAVVTVNAGAGGTDSQDWAEMLLRTEMRWAESRGMKTELLEASPGEEAGIKSATFLAKGENAYGLFSAEKGVHRLVRISPFDSAARRHTAFAGLEVAPFLERSGAIEIEPDDLQIDTYRASGAGGQHVNKTDSAVRITHKPSGTVVQCQNERSQGANKQTAMAMLTSKLVELEEERRRAEIAREKGEAQDAAWGSQIRSYVLQPYTMVKDHRTDVEVGNVQGVLEGNLDPFVRAELLRRAGTAG